MENDTQISSPKPQTAYIQRGRNKCKSNKKTRGDHWVTHNAGTKQGLKEVGQRPTGGYLKNEPWEMGGVFQVARRGNRAVWVEELQMQRPVVERRLSTQG